MANALSELSTKMDAKIAPVLQNPYIAKMTMPLNEEESGKGIGLTTYKGIAYASGYGGRTSLELEFDPEGVDVTSKDYKVPIQQSSRTIKRRDYESFLLAGVGINTDIAVDMLGEVQQQQNATVIDGWKPDGTNYAVLGMYQVANISVTGATAETFGNALGAVSDGIAALQAKNIYSTAGYNFYVNPAQAGEINGNYSNGVAERDLILKNLNMDVPDGSMPGKIITSTNLPDGAGMVAPTADKSNARFFELVEAQVPYNNLWFKDGNEKDGDILARQVSSLFPTFKRLNSSNKTDCVCKVGSL